MSREPERPFLPMSGELGGDLMSGMADSIRERGAREVPGKEGVDDETTFEEEWPEDEEWEEEEWEEEDEWEDEWEESLAEKALNVIEALMPRLVGFAVDVATIAISAMLMLLAIVLFQKTTFEIFRLPCWSEAQR